MMKITVGNLRRLIREKLKSDLRFTITEDMWYECTQLFLAKGDVLAAYRNKLNFDAGGEAHDLAQEIMSVSGVKVSPRNFMETVKEYREVDSIGLDMDNRTRSLIIDDMAFLIADNFESKQIDIVTNVESSSPMSKQLAEKVANLLLKSHTVTLGKIVNPGEIGIEWDEFDDWSKGKSSEEIEEFRNQLIKNLNTLKNKLRNKQKISVASDIKPSRRRFFNLHKFIGENISAGSRVLVIDDNFDTSKTFKHAGKLLQEEGLVPFYAAGYKIMR